MRLDDRGERIIELFNVRDVELNRKFIPEDA
jgi:hypothetical protein